MICVGVDPRMLHWTREGAGLEPERVTVRFKKLPEWEKGKISPTLETIGTGQGSTRREQDSEPFLNQGL